MIAVRGQIAGPASAVAAVIILDDDGRGSPSDERTYLLVAVGGDGMGRAVHTHQGSRPVSSRERIGMKARGDCDGRAEQLDRGEYRTIRNLAWHDLLPGGAGRGHDGLSCTRLLRPGSGRMGSGESGRSPAPAGAGAEAGSATLPPAPPAPPAVGRPPWRPPAAGRGTGRDTSRPACGLPRRRP